MSEAIKPTPGEWRFYTEPQPNGCPIVGANGLMVCMLAHSVNYADQAEEAVANARLIAEAGTVHHETGLTPRQLLGQRDALLAEIEREYTALSDFQNEWHGRNTEAGQAKLCRLRALIAKATGRDEQDVQDDYGTRKHRAAKTTGSTP